MKTVLSSTVRWSARALSLVGRGVRATWSFVMVVLFGTSQAPGRAGGQGMTAADVARVQAGARAQTTSMQPGVF